jgi:DNA-binding transcriptional ArsR family regulator
MHKRSYIKDHEEHPHYVSDNSLKLLQRNFGDISKHDDILTILKNLSDPTKLSIYLLLHKVDEIPVTDIVHVLGVSQSAVSHALSDLKKLDLVECARCGQLMCYRLKKQPKTRAPILLMFDKFFLKN